MDEIDAEIEFEIVNFYKHHYIEDEWRLNSKYIEQSRNYIDEILIKKVLKIHRIVHDSIMDDRDAAFSETIPFEDIWNILCSDLNKTIESEDYFFYTILKDFYQYYQEYSCETELSNTDRAKLSKYINELLSLSKDNILMFFKHIIPHRGFKLETLEDYKNCNITKDEIQDVFFDILKRLRESDDILDGRIAWNSADRKCSPTSIIAPPAHTAKICERIVKNAIDYDLDVLFEGGVLITSALNTDSVFSEVNHELSTDESDEDSVDRITRWKKISLISIDNAEVKINE